MLTLAIAAAVAFVICATGAAIIDHAARKAPSAPAETFTPYTGPLYTPHGREVL